MTDPERLLTSTEDDFERRILRAARRDAGSEEALRRTLGALRVAAGAGAAAAAAKAAAAAELHSAGAGVAGAASIGKIAGFLAIGAVAGTLATGGAVWVLAPARPAVTVQAPSQQRAPLSVPKGTARSAESLAEAPRDPPPTDQAAAPTGRASPAPRVDMPNGVRERAAPEPSDPPRGSALSSELGALEDARGALDRGRPALALELLAAYEARFPNGVLRPEAVVLRIDALAKMGDRTTASGLARRFLASNPRTPHAAHLQALISEQHK